MEFFLFVFFLFAAYGLPGIVQLIAQRIRYARAQSNGYFGVQNHD